MTALTIAKLNTETAKVMLAERGRYQIEKWQGAEKYTVHDTQALKPPWGICFDSKREAGLFIESRVLAAADKWRAENAWRCMTGFTEVFDILTRGE